MNRRWLLGGALLVLVCATGYLKFRGPRQTPAEQVRRVLAKAERGAELQSVPLCLSCVSEDYSDDLGNTKRTLRQLAVQGFYSVEAVDVTVVVEDLSVTGKEARVTARVRIGARTASEQSDETETTMRIRLRRERRGWRDEWKVIRVDGWNLPSVGGY